MQLGKGTSNPDGNSEKHWSYFGDNGWLRTNWVQLGKETNNPDGNSEKHWSYFGSNGWLRTDWVQLGKGTSNPDGNSQRHWSYFGNNGWLRTGLQTMSTSVNPDGNNTQHLSFFGDNGWLVTNKNFRLNDTDYSADSRGWITIIPKTETEATLSFVSKLQFNKDINSLSSESKEIALWMIDVIRKGKEKEAVYPQIISDYDLADPAINFVENNYFHYADGPFYSRRLLNYKIDKTARLTVNAVLSNEYMNRSNTVEKWVKQIANSIMYRGMKETDAIVALDNWFRKNYSYKAGQNLYSAYLNKGGTCATYAQLTQEICNYVGMDCKYVSGTARGGYHAWNRIKVNGKWYYFDFTWNVNYPSSQKKYFMSEKPFANHTISSEKSV